MGRAPGLPSVPGYELVRRLGGGAFGDVYLARQESLDRRVALKLMAHRIAGDESSVRRFRKEAELLAGLEHDAIVAVYDAGEAPGLGLFLALQLVDGPSLDRVLHREGALGWRRAAGIFAPVAEALAHAHGMGVLHRDIKPGNILLDREERAYLADFGLARMHGPGWTRLTRPGAIVGTPQFLAPELVEGDPATEAADVYALATTIYMALAGRPPYGLLVELAALAQRLDEDPEPLPEEVGPEGLRALVDAGVARDHWRRPTARELADGIARVLEDPDLSGAEVSRSMVVRIAKLAPHAPPARTPGPGVRAGSMILGATLAVAGGVLGGVLTPPPAPPPLPAPAPVEDAPGPARPAGEVPRDLEVAWSLVRPAPFPDEEAARGLFWVGASSDLEAAWRPSHPDVPGWPGTELPARVAGGLGPGRAATVVVLVDGGRADRVAVEGPDGRALPVGLAEGGTDLGVAVGAAPAGSGDLDIRLVAPAGAPGELRAAWVGTTGSGIPTTRALEVALLRVRNRTSALDRVLRGGVDRRMPFTQVGQRVEARDWIAMLLAGEREETPDLEERVLELREALQVAHDHFRALAFPLGPDETTRLLQHALVYLTACETLGSLVPPELRRPPMPGHLRAYVDAAAGIVEAESTTYRTRPRGEAFLAASAAVAADLPPDLAAWVTFFTERVLFAGRLGMLDSQAEVLPQLADLVGLAVALPLGFEPAYGGHAAILRELALVLLHTEDHIGRREKGFQGPAGVALLASLESRLEQLPPGPGRNQDLAIVGRSRALVDL